MISRRWLIGAACAAVVGGATFLWTSRPPAAPTYLSAPVQTGDIEDAVLANGEIKAFKQVNVGAQASGQIKTLKVALGQAVKRGDLIAEIDSLTQQNALKNAQAALRDVQAQRRSKQASLIQYELAFTRQRDMLAQDASARADFESAQATLAATQADIAALDAQIEQARIAVDTATVNLGYTRIVAPMDGVVVSLVVQEGQTVNATQTTPTIVKLARLDTMTVQAQISEADVIRVKPGQAVYFTILGEPGRRYDTTLRAIEPGPESYSTDSSSSSSTTSTSSTSSSSTSSSSSTAIYYNGLFDVPNPQQTLRISMTAEVSIVLAKRSGVLTMPAAALGDKLPDGRYRVRVLDAGGKAQPRDVKTGLDNNATVEVVDGLKAGERVVVGDSAQATSNTDNGGRPHGPPPMGM